MSETLKRELIEEYGIHRDRIKVVYNGAEIHKRREERVEREAEEKREKQILFVGDLCYRKGLDFLIEAMKGINGVKLLIAGKPNKRYKKLATGLQVEFLGFKPNINDVFQEVDALILPSIYEPFGIVVFEAMASGVPVIVSSHAGVSELIQDMENGIIIKDPTNVSEIREKINLIVANPELRKKLAVQGLTTAKEYSWKKMVKKKEELITRCVS